MAGDLRRGPAQADFRPEIDLKLIGGTARFRIRFGGDDGACADIDLQEILEGDAGYRRVFRAQVGGMLVTL